MKIEIESALPEDTARADIQLGHNYKVYGVAARCPHGAPQVVVLNPIDDTAKGAINYSALANLVWLSCPMLRKKVDELEERGMVNKAQQLLHKDRSLATMMNDAHAHFYYLRKELFRRIMLRSYREEETQFFDTGIGGIKDIRTVRCLHMHFAHFALCPKNMVGRAVEGLLGGALYSGCGDRQCMK